MYIDLSRMGTNVKTCLYIHTQMLRHHFTFMIELSNKLNTVRLITIFKLLEVAYIAQSLFTAMVSLMNTRPFHVVPVRLFP